MITSIDYKKKQFTYLHDSVETTFLFRDIESSDAWVKNKVISFEHLDSFGKKCRTTLSRNAFTDNIAFHNKEMRGDTMYELDRNIFLLYRHLEGETLANAHLEVENIEKQRKELDDRKRAYKERVDAIIKAHVEKENENAEIKASKEKLNELGRKLASTNDEKDKESLGEELAAHMSLDMHLREEHKIPDRPSIPAMDFVVSHEMKKVIAVALDDSIPHITLKNVTLDSANEVISKKLSR